MDDIHGGIDLTLSNQLQNSGVSLPPAPYGLEAKSSLPGGISIVGVELPPVLLEPQVDAIAFSTLDNSALVGNDILTGANSSHALLVGGDWENTPLSEGKQIVVIDPGVEDYQNLLAGVAANIEIVVLDGNKDGVSQIGEFLAQQNNISAIHVVTHGQPGIVQLGTTQLSSDNLAEYGSQLQGWAGALTENADILFYGCNLAQGDQGRAFVDELSWLTGADVAASNDLTGAASLGGDWDLEVSQGTIETPIAFNQHIVQTYDGLLAVSVNLIGNTATFTGDGNNDSLYLRVNASNQLEFSTNGTNFSNDLSLSGAIQPLVISANTLINVNLGGGADSLYIDTSLNNALISSNASLNFIGGAGADTLSGSNTDNTWTITDVIAGNGNLNNVINFSGTENLFGGSAIDIVITDALTTAWNRVSGSLTNAYNIASTEISNAAGVLVSEVNSAIGVTGDVINDIETFLNNLSDDLVDIGSDLTDFINNGIATFEGLLNGAVNAFLTGANYAQVLYTSTIDAANLFIENVITKANDDFLFSSINSANVTIQASPILSDDLILERIKAGELRVRTVTSSDIIDFKDPTESLTINLGLGDDKITVSPLTLNASLTINGGFGFDPSLPFVDYLDGKDTVIFSGNLNLPSKDLTVLTENITVDTGVTISTQKAGENSGNIDLTGTIVNIDSNAKLFTKAIADNKTSGKISIAANVKDFSGISPIDVFPSEDVSVNIASGVQIEGGEISIAASKESQTGILPILIVALQSKEAKINIQGATIKGDSVSINANAADGNILEDDATLVNNLAIQPLINLLDVAGLALTAIGAPAILSAVSVSMRKSDALVSLTDTQIISDGDVSIGADNSVSSVASAGGGLEPARRGRYKANVDSFPFSAGYSKAEGSAQTLLSGTTSIQAGGNVEITSNAETTAEVGASTAVNSSLKARGTTTIKNPTQAFGVSVAVTESSTTSKAIIGENVSIVADGNVKVGATGESNLESKSGVAVFIDGSGAIGVAVGSDKVDIQSLVNGKITAGSVQQQGVDLTTNVNTANDTITLAHHGLKTGDELLYIAADPNNPDTSLTAIGGLVSGQTYKVIVIDENTLKLTQGDTIPLNASRSVGVNPDATQTLNRRNILNFDPATDVNAVTNTITIAGHKFTNGQEVDYWLGNEDAEQISGLSNQDTYAVVNVNGNSFQLAVLDNTLPGATNQTVILNGKTYYILDLELPSKTNSVFSFDPTGTTLVPANTTIDSTSDEIIFSSANSFSTGQKVRYSNGGGSNIGGLSNNTDYYVIRVSGSNDHIKLATSYENAINGVFINNLSGTGVTGTSHSFTGQHQHIFAFEETALAFKPSEAVNNDDGTITFNQDHGWQTGDAVVYRTDSTVKKEAGMTRFSNFALADATLTFNPTSLVEEEPSIDVANNLIFFNEIHNFVTGQRVKYSNGGGSNLGGLSNNTDYFVINTGDNNIQLATSRANALAGIAIDLTSAGTGTSHNFLTNAVDLADNLFVVDNHDFQTGQKVTYVTDGGNAVSGLTNQTEYYVIRINENIFKLATSRANASAGVAIDLTGVGTGTSHTFKTDVFVSLFDASRTAPVVDPVQDTLELKNHGLTNGEKVTYYSSDGDPIPGLTNGSEYSVIVVDANHIQFADTDPNTPLAALQLGNGSSTGISLQYLTTDSKTIEFDPSIVPVLEGTTDTTISMFGHGFKTGDRITYLTGGGTAVGGLTDGKEYIVIRVDDNNFQLADPNSPNTPIAMTAGVATGENHGFERVSRATRGDLPLDGLTSNEIYYVVKVDDRTIRLTDSPITAQAALPIDLTLAAGQTGIHTFAVPGESPGISIVAELESDNRTITESTIGGIPTLTDYLAGTVPPEPKAVKGLIAGASAYLRPAKGSTFSINAAVAVNSFDHNVIAQAGSTAVLKSDADINITASAEQGVQANAQGGVSNEVPGTGGKVVSGSVAVAVGNYDTTVKAIVANGAKLDAKEAISVTSDISYPLLVDSLPFNPNRFDLGSPDDGSIQDELAQAFNGRFGLDNMINTWAVTKNKAGAAPGQAAKVSIAGSIGVSSYLNRSEAIIESGALINQDPLFQNDDQSVEVAANTAMELINIAGIIQLDVKPEPGAIALAIKAKSSPFSLFGNEAGLVGVGGALLIQTLENHTIARIGDGAKIFTGNDGLNVSATEDILSVDLAQTGGNSGLFGVSGSLSFANQNSETIAQIDSGATVVGGDVSVTATSIVDHYNIVGAVQLAKSVGVGVSIGSTAVKRDTAAIIGKRRTDSDQSVGTNGTNFNVSSIDVTATNTGKIWGIGVAGAVVSDIPVLSIPSQPALPSNIGVGISGVIAFNRITDSTQAYINDSGLLNVNGGKIAVKSEDRTGIFSISGAATLVKAGTISAGISGSFSVNELNMKTEASITGATIQQANDLTVEALRDGSVFAFTIGVAVAAAVPTTGGLAGAGTVALSLSDNKITSTTRSYLKGVDVTLPGEVSLNAQDISVIAAIAVGGAGSGAAGVGGAAAALAVAGGVTTNTIDNTVESFIKDSGGSKKIQANLVTLTASDDSTIRAVAGGFAIAIATGAGGAKGAGAVGLGIANNKIGKGNGHAVRAYIDNAVVIAEEDVILKAISTATIEALAMGGAGAGAGGAGGVTGALAGAGAGTENVIQIAIEASIKNNSTVSANNGDVSLTASDSSIVKADAGGIAIAIAASLGAGAKGAASIGAAVATNTVNNSVKALIDGPTVTAQSDVILSATSTAEIDALALGGAGAGAGGAGAGLTGALAGAGAGTVNNINLEIEASLKNNSTVTANNGDVTLTANDNSTINADAGGVAVAIAANLGGGATGSGAIGAAVSTNTVNNSVKALIDDSAVTAQSDVILNATSTAEIDAFALGGAGAGAGGAGAGLTGALAGAGAGTINTINLEIAASVKNTSTVDADTGIVTLTALDTSQIKADAGGVAVAIAASAGAGAAGSGAIGAGIAINNISNTVVAVIDDSLVTAAGDVNLTATAKSQTDKTFDFARAAVNAVNNTISYTNHGLKTGDRVIYRNLGNVGQQLGGLEDGQSYFVIKVDDNTIKLVATNAETTASEPAAIDLTTGTAGTNHRFETLKPRIQAIAIAGAAAGAGTATGAGLAGSGAGAQADNTINNIVEAYIKGSENVTAGDSVNVKASDDSNIQADSGGFAVAIGATATGAAGALSIGASLSDNTIGDSGIKLTNHGLNTGDAVVYNGTGDAIGGLVKGQIYYVIKLDDNRIQLAATLNEATGSNNGTPNDTSDDIFVKPIILDRTVAGASHSLTKGGTVKNFSQEDVFQSLVRATIIDSNVTAANDVILSAISAAQIDALAIGGAASGAGTGAGLAGALAGAGAGSTNAIAQVIIASIENNSDVTATNGDVDLLAVDTSKIKADAGGVAISVAVSLAGTAGAASVGLAISDNNIGNKTKAYIDSSTVNAASDVDLDANSTAEINAFTFGGAGAVSVSVGAGAGAASAAGAGSTNTIANVIEAYILDSSGVKASLGSVSLSATDDAKIQATAHGGSLALSGSDTVSVSLSIAAVDANNTLSNQVRSFIDNSTVEALNGTVTVIADSNSSINSEAVAASVGGAISLFSGGFSGAGAGATNNIGNTIEAAIKDNSTVRTRNTLRVTATDNSSISSDVGAGSLAFGAVGGSIGVSVTDNTINNSVRAFIDGLVTVTNGNVEITADSTATANSFAIATSIAASVFGGFAGAGSDAKTTIGGTVEAYLGTAGRLTVNSATGDAIIKATSNQNTTTKASGTAISLGAVGAAVGVTLADTTFNGITRAYSQGEIAAANDFTVEAQNIGTATTETFALSAAIGGFFNVSGTGTKASANITPTVTAYVVVPATVTMNLTGDLSVRAVSELAADAKAQGVAASTGAGIGSSQATVTVAANLDAYVGGKINARSLAIIANLSGEKAQAFASGSSGGLLLGVDSTSTSVINNSSTQSYVLDNANLNINNATNVTAISTTNQKAESNSAAGGIIAVGVSKSNVSTNTNTEAYFGSGVRLIGGTLNISAVGADTNLALTTAGSGGIGAGTSASATTSNTSTTLAKIKDDLSGNSSNTIDIDLSSRGAGTLTIGAKHTANFDTQIKTGAGGVIAGSGAANNNQVISAVESGVGNNVNIKAKDIAIDATNRVRKNLVGGGENLKGTTGGLASGAGADSETTISLSTLTTVGNNAVLTVVGNTASNDTITLRSLNDINVTDKVTLTTGGAVSGADATATVRSLSDLAKVAVGTGATLQSTGGIDISARGQGDIKIQVNAETYGIGTVAIANSKIDLKPTNEIAIGNNAKIRAGGNLNLSAGTDTNFNRDSYTLESRTDTFAGSAIPISSINAEAYLLQENKITVASGAILETARDAKLHAERDGFANLIAQAKAVNWFNALGNAIDKLLGGGGTEQYEGFSKSEAHGTVQVDGTVRTGINRNLTLELNAWDRDTGTITNFTKSDGINFTVTLEKVQSNLEKALEQAKAELIKYGDTNATLKTFYEGEIARIQAALAAEGLLQTGGPDGLTNRVEQYAITVTVDPILAQAGTIDIRSDQLQGNGVFDAPGDASVNILNHTPAFIKILGITIPEQNGGLFLNGVEVSAAVSLSAIKGEINAENSRNATQDNQSNLSGESLVVAGVAAFSSITGGGSANEPLIQVINDFDVTSITNDIYPWPDITVLGDIENLGGDLVLRTLASGQGDITVKGRIRVQNSIIEAGGSATFDLPGEGTSFPVAGEDYAKWLSVTGGAKPPGTGGITQANQAGIDSILNQIPTNVSLYGDRIFINAEYVNINGIIQSGKSDYELTLSAATIQEIDDLLKAGTTGIVTLKTITNKDFLVRYDVANNQIILEELRVSGGSIDITGHILNSANGEIKLLGGYGKINVTNNTPYDLVIKRLDVSQSGAGTLVLKDKAKGTSANPFVTIYQKTANGVTITTDNGSGSVVSQGSNNSTYNPKSGWRYGWSIGKETRTRTTTTYGTSSWLGIDALAKDPDTVVGTPKVENITEPQLLPEGSYYFLDANNTTRYDFVKPDPVTLAQRTYTGDSWTESTWYGTKTYYQQVISETRQQEIYTHTIEADRAIKINFIGYDEGAISVQSQGNILLDGPILNPTGTTSLSSDKSIKQGSDNGYVGGRRVELSAVTGIGSEQAIQTDVANESTASVKATTSDGTIQISEIVGDLAVDQISAGGGKDVTVTAQAGIKKANEGLISGGSITLNALGGNIGASGQSIVLESGTTLKDKVNITATGDIFLKEKTGDLRVEKIETIGNVTVEVSQGSIVDANQEAQRDDRTINELRAGVWSDLQLTAGTGATAKIAETINAFAQVKEQEYNTYWQYRNTQANPSVYDSNHQVTLTNEEVVFYDNFYREQGIAQNLSGAALNQFVQNAITTLENSRTLQYHTLHAQYGQFGNTFNDNFTYTLTAEEDTALRGSIKVWTEEELIYTLSAGLLKAVSDTQVSIEDPNIIGNNVTLITSGGVGKSDGQTVIDLSVQPVQLTSDDRIKLAAAERDDLVYLGGDPVTTTVNFTDNGSADTITRTDTGSWITDGFQAGMYIFIEGNSTNATDDGQYYQIASVTATTITLTASTSLRTESGVSVTIAPVVLDPSAAGAVVTAVIIKEREDIDVDALGDINVTAGADVFLGSELNINLNQIQAQEQVRIKTGQSIVNGGAADLINVISSELILEAGQGSIGTASDRLDINLTANGTLTARANNDVYISETSGNMNLEGVFSKTGGVYLNAAQGSIVDALNHDFTKIQANRVELTAGAAIGENGDNLEIDVVGTGTLTATAQNTIWIAETFGDLNIRNVLSRTGDVNLRAQLSILDAVDLNNPLDPNSGDDTTGPASKPKADIIGNNISLTAVLGGIGLSGNDLDINSAFSGAGTLTASSGFANIYIIETAGDLSLNQVGTGTGATAFITVPAGSILDGNSDPNGFNIISGKTFLVASQNIGAANRAITTEIGNIEAKSTAGSTWVSNTGALTIGGVVDSTDPGMVAGGSINLTASSPITVTENQQAGAEIIVWATDDNNDSDVDGTATPADDDADFLIVKSGIKIESTGSYVRLLAGDDLTVEAGAIVKAADYVELYGDYQGAVDASGSKIQVLGTVEANTRIDISGDANSDRFLLDGSIIAPVVNLNAGAADDEIVTSGTITATNSINFFGQAGEDEIKLWGNLSATEITIDAGSENDTILLNPENTEGNALTLAGDTSILGGTGTDFIQVFKLPSLDKASRILPGRNTPGRDTLDLDGQGDADTYEISITGTSTDYIINVFDTGTTGADTLTVFGTETADNLLMRASDREFVDGGVAFVAALHSDPTTDVERINYNKNIEQLTVDAQGGDDQITLDNNWTQTTVKGGLGNDSFQVGQVFKTERDVAKANLAFEDEFATTQTTRGFLSNGVSFTTTIEGEAGEDTFVVFRNTATLDLAGGDGNDLFVIRSFAEEGSSDSAVDAGAGADTVEYVVNAALNITGGAGIDTLRVIGTEFGDNFVVAANGIFGAGRSITYDGIEILEIDGAEGDDKFFVLSTSNLVTTKLFGGLGSDSFSIGGDSAAVVGADGALVAQAGTHKLDSIAGALFIDGFSGQGSAGGLGDPVILPGETNQRPATGNVLAYNGTGAASAIDNLTVETSDLQAFIAANPAIADISALVGRTLEISKGKGINRFWLIVGVAAGSLPGQTVLTLQNASLPASEWELPDSNSEFAITNLSPNFFVNENNSRDTVTVFNDGSTANGVGTLSASTLTGFGMNPAGINYGSLEVVELLLGQGDEELTVTGTADGAITSVHGGGGNDKITVSDRGGTDARGLDAPLAIFGDTSADASRYSGTGTTIQPGLAWNFNNPGNDTIDASLSSDNVVIYGGAGNDSIRGSQAGDQIAGGSGNDNIQGEAGNDIIYGDSGFNVDLVGRTLSVPTTETAGQDAIAGNAGDDIIFGDHGIVTQTAATPKLLSTDNVQRIETTNASGGANDNIQGNTGNDRILGGAGADNITGDDNADILIGDNGVIDFVINDSNLATVDIIQTTNATIGSADVISGNAGDDTILGGALGDNIDGGNENNLILGDNGAITYTNGAVSQIASTDFALGGDDSITTTTGADIIVGGIGSDVITAADGNNILLGDNGTISIAANGLSLIDTTAPEVGGNDVISTGTNNDVVLAGSGNDTVTAGDGQNLVIGDNGTATYAAGVLQRLETTDPTLGGNDSITTGEGEDIVLAGVGSDTVTTNSANDIVLGDNGIVDYVGTDGNAADIDLITTTNPNNGGNDNISTGAGNDFVLAGTGADTVSSGSSNDLIFGDHGEVRGDISANALPLNTASDPFTFTSLNTQNSEGGGNDSLVGDGGEDIILGGQGNDTITGNAGDDDIWGGHNVAGGQDGDDILDGGAGNDAIAGDNAKILRKGNSISSRIRTLSNGTIYDSNGNPLVTAASQANPTGVSEREIVLYDHSDTPLPQTSGNDSIAGGADDDVIFGQLGNDTIQGDGSTSINVSTTSQSVEDFGGVGTDGDDYIEGNGGNDLIFGNLGQDDIIGDSSSLFGLINPSDRPTGADIIFGGAGTQTARNHLGNLSSQGHALDADTILGDNGIIYRLVGTNGTATGNFITFTYDNYDPNLKIIPRAVRWLDYTPGDNGTGDRGFADIISGEGGDDQIHGMTGNDVLFGNGQDDDLFGEDGADRLYGGAGEDGIVGDNGMIRTSRNGSTETLYGLTTPNLQVTLSASNEVGAVEYITGRLTKAFVSIAWTQGGNDVIYGGLGDDFIHGGAGDDAISGAEALAAFYNADPVTNLNPLGYNATTRKLAAYNANNPYAKINGFLLNFEATDSAGVKIEDGKDRIFGDLGNDWLVGGTGKDRLFGGLGDDLINADDNLDTNGGLNNQPDAPAYADPDFVYGGGGLDVMIANTGGDRLIDWNGEFNSYFVPFSQFGAPTVIRIPNNNWKTFVTNLGRTSGADQSLTEPNGEVGLVNSDTGAPRDPQPGTQPGQIDTNGSPENDTGILPNNAGSTPRA
ncbi:DUF4347 domain-containing protein [Nostoc sp. FACHB-152]|uniref:DUF4347 domain-containing protein n=1 Tax=unclassified Nostoc TaxID=2593658 RepID=UPI001682A2E5|nr:MULTISPECIES: DUF4347 domain-containing protein [unclassified Nostoc]MBD2449019.1 DUF4347 domain-containing protein [Nostoc sp. FACHB-152]MBD2469749.1 DUF4347 domain-containing protein [Nostoc sp. FACHB-145]